MPIPIGGTPGALYHIPGPFGIVPFQGPTSWSGGGAQVVTRRATSSPRRLPAIASSAPRDADLACSRSCSSSRAIEARTVESVSRSERMAADALATAASDETARSPCAEFAAAYWATLRRAYTRKRNGGGVCAIRRNTAESPAAAAAFRAARLLAVASSMNRGTSRFQRTLIGEFSTAGGVVLAGATCALSTGRAVKTMSSGSRSNRLGIRIRASIRRRGLRARDRGADRVRLPDIRPYGITDNLVSSYSWVIMTTLCQQAPPARNQHCATGDVLKKSSSSRPTFCSPDCDGCVPSLSTSAVVHTSPSVRPSVPRVQR